MATLDPIAKIERAQRRRKLLEAMEQQNISAPIVGSDSGYALGQALTKLGTAAVLRESGKDVDNREIEGKHAYNQQLSAAVKSFMEKSQGAPGMHELAPGLAGPQVPPIEADPQAAIIEAMTSRLPEMQGLGKAQMMAQLQREKENFQNPITVMGPDGKPQLVQFGNRGSARPIQGMQPTPEVMAVGNRVVNKLDPTQVKADFSEQWSEPFSQGGDLYQRNLGSGQIRKLDNASKVNVNTSVSPIIQGQKAGMGEWAKLAGQAVSEMAANARQSVQTMSSLNQMEELNKSGLNTGPLATPAGFVQGLAHSVGIPIDTAKLSNSQAFESEATRAWAAMMQANGGARGLVKEESEKIAASLPSLTQSPEGRAKIIAVLRMKAEQDIKDAQTASKEYSSALQSDDPAKFTFGLGQAQLPNTQPRPAVPGVAQPTGQSGGAIPWSEYKKRLQGGR